MAKKKSKLFDIKNVLTTLKSWVVSIIAGIPTALIMYGRTRATEPNWQLLFNILGLGSLIFTLFFWGFLAKKWWKWS